MRRVTCMNASCHIHWRIMSHTWMRHVTHMNESFTHINESCHTYERVMSHIWMSHVTHMNASCHIHEWLMSYMWTMHVTRMNVSCHTYECVMSHIGISEAHRGSSCRQIPTIHLCDTNEWVMQRICMSQVSYMDVSCHTYECVILELPQNPHHPPLWHKWMSHVTRICTTSVSYMDVSCHTYECVMLELPRNPHYPPEWHIWMSHITRMNESSLVYGCVMSHIWMRHTQVTAKSPLGCNNGTGGLHENLVTFRAPKMPYFVWAQKMRLKKCSS